MPPGDTIQKVGGQIPNLYSIKEKLMADSAPDTGTTVPPAPDPGYKSSEVQAFPLLAILTTMSSAGILKIPDSDLRYAAIALLALTWIGWVFLFVGRTWLKNNHLQALQTISALELQAEGAAAALEKLQGMNVPLPTGLPPAPPTVVNVSAPAPAAATATTNPPGGAP